MNRNTILLAITDRACSQLNDGESRPDLRGAEWEIDMAAKRYRVILSEDELEDIRADIVRRLT